MHDVWCPCLAPRAAPLPGAMLACLHSWCLAPLPGAVGRPSAWGHAHQHTCVLSGALSWRRGPPPCLGPCSLLLHAYRLAPLPGAVGRPPAWGHAHLHTCMASAAFPAAMMCVVSYFCDYMNSCIHMLPLWLASICKSICVACASETSGRVLLHCSRMIVF